MDVSECESSTEGETMELQHFSHQHPLVFFKYQQTVASEEVDPEAALCRGCEKPVEGWSYGCNQCEFYLHKGCAELELAPQIQHPFHPKHPLTLLPESLYPGGCDFCGKAFRGFVYNCYDCRFDLHINCALLQSSVAANFPNSLHPHPLFFIQNHNNEVDSDCPGCQKPISGPFYHCSDCSYPTFFNLHKECAELPLEINHPCDRKHPLTLLPQPPTHPQKCSCYLCRIQWKGFVYSCSLCNFDLSLDDFLFSPPTIKVASHEHQWMLVSRKMSFVCDFCGTEEDYSPYHCDTCVLFVHKNCISLPCHIRITRHRHTISLSYSFRQNQVDDQICGVCCLEVDTSYGSYRCSASDCNYFAHALCATDKKIWDGKFMLEGYDERSEEVVNEPWNLITDDVEQISNGEQMVAIEIKHSYHDHNLKFTLIGETKDDRQCDGCTRPISTPFYSCEQCKFFLHKDCAELPKKMPHPFHRHLLNLTNSHNKDGISLCSACKRLYQGFSYICYKKNCFFKIDLQCKLSLDTLKHPSHEHSLFLDHKNQGSRCNACFVTLDPRSVAYRCMKRCDYTLDVGCATLPLTAWYKYDRHTLTLTYSDDSEPSQHYCDLCEKEREPNRWFYYCADCDNSLHLNCAIGDLPYMKLGNKFNSFFHKHLLTIVKNIWNCPPCKVCREVCNGRALKCKESECNFTVHWDCHMGL